MKTSKQQLAEAISAAGGLHSIKVGSRLFIFDGESRDNVERQAERYALRTGEMMEFEDGRRVFFSWTPVERAGKSGSDRFEWHADGNRVLHRLLQTTIQDGKSVAISVKHAYRALDII